MPNELGLLTKQEAKIIRDLLILPETDCRAVFVIARMIRALQIEYEGLQYSEVIINMVVHDMVASYFKNTVGYTVTEDKTGQPPNYTRLLKISWAL